MAASTDCRCAADTHVCFRFGPKSIGGQQHGRALSSISSGKAPTSAEIAKRTAAGASPDTAALASDSEVSLQHRFSMKGGLELQWAQKPTAKDSQPFWQRYTLSPQSVLDLHAELVDQDARLLSSFFPDTQSSGKLAGALDLTGTLESPQVSGNLGWENGVAKQSILGTACHRYSDRDQV